MKINDTFTILVTFKITDIHEDYTGKKFGVVGNIGHVIKDWADNPPTIKLTMSEAQVNKHSNAN